MTDIATALNELGITEWVLRGEPTTEVFKGFKETEDLNRLDYKDKIKPLLQQHSEINDRICEIFYKN